MFITNIRADASDSDRSPFGNFWFEPVGMRAAGGMRVTTASALALPAVWAAVQVLAQSFALMPFDLYKPRGPGQESKQRRRDHWLYRLIAKRPNDFQTPVEFRMMLQGHLALRGNAFAQIAADSRGRVTDLLPLHPDRMTIEMLPSGTWRYRYVDQNGKTLYFTRGEIWHLKGLSSDGIVGMSCIEFQREIIGEGLAMQGYSSRFFANDARPGGWIENPGQFANEPAKKTFKESWQSNYGGKNIRKVAVLERGMKYHELTLNNADAQFIEARANNVNEIARIFRIPPHKIGDLEKSTNNNIEHQSIEFWTDAMAPWALIWKSSIETNLLGADDPDGLECDFPYAALMRGDGKSRAERLGLLVNGGILVRNEAREEEGYDPVQGLNKPLVQLAMGTVDEEGNIQAPKSAVSAPAQNPESAPAPKVSGRLAGILRASSERLARRAAGSLEKKAAAEVFDEDFAALMTEALGIEPNTAAECCGRLALMPDISEPAIRTALFDCALEDALA